MKNDDSEKGARSPVVHVALLFVSRNLYMGMHMEIQDFIANVHSPEQEDARDES